MAFTGVSPFVAAHYMLQKHAELAQSDWGNMAPIKLLKMAYIAHGFHLALTDAPLVDTEIEAWPYGPVLPEIYHGVKDFKRRTVPVDLFKLYADDLEKQEDEGKLAGNEESLAIINRVVVVYGPFDGLQLSAATHKKGTPWSQIYKEDPGGVIPNDLIGKYYKGLLT